jgi:hypothetical protein
MKNIIEIEPEIANAQKELVELRARGRALHYYLHLSHSGSDFNPPVRTSFSPG